MLEVWLDLFGNQEDKEPVSEIVIAPSGGSSWNNENAAPKLSLGTSGYSIGTKWNWVLENFRNILVKVVKQM